jgi:hypothetical protein
VWQIPDAVDTVVYAPDDGWKYHPKHVEQFPNINKLCNVASYWIYECNGILLGARQILHISRITVNYIGSGRNTLRFCKTVVSGTVGLGNLSLSVLLARLKAFQLPWSTVVSMERWSVEHRVFIVETVSCRCDSLDISSALQYSWEWVSLVAILLPLGIS